MGTAVENMASIPTRQLDVLEYALETGVCVKTGKPR
jgi:hypothetical protein